MKTTMKIALFVLAMTLFGFALDERYAAGLIAGATAVAAECSQYREQRPAGFAFALEETK